MQIIDALSDAKRVLVFNPSFIGDAILTTPLVNAIHQLLPQAKIDFCVRPESEPILKGGVASIIPFDKRKSGSGLMGILAFAKFLKSQRYDLVVSLHKSFRTSLLLKLSNIPFKVGFAQSSFSSVYDCVVNRDMKIHEVLRNLSLLEPIVKDYTIINATQLGGKLYTYLDEECRQNLTKNLDGQRTIGITPGSTWNTKKYPAVGYAELAEMLHSNGCRIVIIGGPADVAETDIVAKYLDSKCVPYVNFANKVPFDKIPAVISGLDLLVTNDSASMHIAVSQNVPTVAIFGATVPSLGFAPYDNESVVVEDVDLPCRPCGLHGGKTCPLKHFKCMLDIPVTTIYKACLGVLEKGDL